MVSPEPWQKTVSSTPPTKKPKKPETAPTTSKKKSPLSRFGAAVGSGLAGIGGPIGAVGGAALGALVGPEKKPTNVGPFTTQWHSPEQAWDNLVPGKEPLIKSMSGKGGGGSKTGNLNGRTFLDQSVLPEDVLLGRIDVSTFNTSDDDPYWLELQKTRPELAKSIVDKKNIDYQKLVQQATRGDVGNAVLDPMAVQLLFQKAINPFLSQVLQGANQQTQNYQGLMSQLTNDPNLPAPYRQTLKAQAPQQAANMNQLTTALAGYTATQPSISSLLQLLNNDYQAQQQRIAMERMGQQQALSGQLFSALNG